MDESRLESIEKKLDIMNDLIIKLCTLALDRENEKPKEEEVKVGQ